MSYYNQQPGKFIPKKWLTNLQAGSGAPIEPAKEASF